MGPPLILVSLMLLVSFLELTSANYHKETIYVKKVMTNYSQSATAEDDGYSASNDSYDQYEEPKPVVYGGAKKRY